MPTAPYMPHCYPYKRFKCSPCVDSTEIEAMLSVRLEEKKKKWQPTFSSS
ncbi:hypothetical protein LguiB_021713 [Lonicera macranthoides]